MTLRGALSDLQGFTRAVAPFPESKPTSASSPPPVLRAAPSPIVGGHARYRVGAAWDRPAVMVGTQWCSCCPRAQASPWRIAESSLRLGCRDSPDRETPWPTADQCL